MKHPRNQRRHSRPYSWVCASGATLLLIPAFLFGTVAAWWTEPDPLDSSLAPVQLDDYAAINARQLKDIASLARDELQAQLPGGAGREINQLVTSFRLWAPTITQP